MLTSWAGGPSTNIHTQTGGNTSPKTVPDLRKRALSAAYGGAPPVAFFPSVKCLFPTRNFHFGRPKTNFNGFKKRKKSEKKGGPPLPPPVMPLGHFDLVACVTFPFSLFFFFFVGALRKGREPCHQLLTLLTLLSTTAPKLSSPSITQYLLTSWAGGPSTDIDTSCSPRNNTSPRTLFSSLSGCLELLAFTFRNSSQSPRTMFMCLSKARKVPMKVRLSWRVTRIL